MSGMPSDSRTIVDHMRVQAQNYRGSVGDPIGVHPVTESAGNLVQSFDNV
jgi:20S proteasome alpha/beta subunit